MLKELYNLSGYNENIFILINNITNIGSFPYIALGFDKIFFIANFSIIYLFICAFFYLKIKELPEQENYFYNIYNELVYIGICYAMFGFIFAGLKFGINLPRPFCSLSALDYTTIINIKGERCLSSFPSAHMGIAILYSYFLWPYINKIMKILCILTVILVAISRLTLAMHYPSDILISALVTFITLLLSRLLFKLTKRIITDPVGKFIFHLLFIKK